MKKFARLLVMLCLSAAAFAATAQNAPPPGYGSGGGWREMPPEQREQMREQMREERRERRDAWMQMSPEERHQLRRDIRDAGQAIYPRGRNRGRN